MTKSLMSLHVCLMPICEHLETAPGARDVLLGLCQVSLVLRYKQSVSNKHEHIIGS